MKLFVQALSAAALTAISSIVQGQQDGQPFKVGQFFGVEPVTSSDDGNVFTGMTVTAVWADGTPERVNGVGLYYLDKDGVERVFNHGVAKTKQESMILREGEYVDVIGCVADGSIITYFEFLTNKNNYTSAGTRPTNFWYDSARVEGYELGGFRSNQEQGKLNGVVALWVCRDPQVCNSGGGGGVAPGTPIMSRATD